MISNCFLNKKILITGHTGFKGSWLSFWLSMLGANVTGLSDKLVSNPSMFEILGLEAFVDHRLGDIRDTNLVTDIIDEVQPNFIFHLAAQPVVYLSFEDPITTMTTNAIGSANVLQGMRHIKEDCVAIMVTSDKVYKNVEWSWGYRETDALGGKDPYSASKGMAELAIESMLSSFFNSENKNIRVGIGRAGNVIGGGDWASNRVVPDCIRSWTSNKPANIRSPNSTRPWQHVLEPISGYMCLAHNLSVGSSLHGEAFNFGPAADQNFAVKTLLEVMAEHWGGATWQDVSDHTSVPEAKLLKLNCEKASSELNWSPILRFEETVSMTIEWYKKALLENTDMQTFTKQQINSYMELGKNRGAWWLNV